ncbi:hypothetical protein [Flavobacterium soyangense]|uniref:Uncharacterized protein n=1 Tax=Flavobacterium soyangense TaxID=2023265 RepID=A0A930U5Z4_9FLAO|nr:hypothetical protein [Flavobacterium soyangense]MBF2707436.1 hypothetical protein [Flavobacterium soyangense]
MKLLFAIDNNTFVLQQSVIQTNFMIEMVKYESTLTEDTEINDTPIIDQTKLKPRPKIKALIDGKEVWV